MSSTLGQDKSYSILPYYFRGVCDTVSRNHVVLNMKISNICGGKPSIKPEAECSQLASLPLWGWGVCYF